jgi:4-aminobutyrate aminotransferase-like enzyme
MDAWGASRGASIHTQTFLGNPVGCAMALAVLDVIAQEGLVARAARSGEAFAQALAAVPGVTKVTGRGLMLGVHVPDTLAVTRRMLEKGFIVLPCGADAEALGITPPLVITEEQMAATVDALRGSL